MKINFLDLIERFSNCLEPVSVLIRGFSLKGMNLNRVILFASVMSSGVFILSALMTFVGF